MSEARSSIMVAGELIPPPARPGQRETDDNGWVWAVEQFKTETGIAHHWVLRSEPRDTPPGEPADSGPRPRFALEVKGGDAATPDGPGEPGYVKITPVPPETVETAIEHFTAPATDTGRVDFREMLKTDAAWGMRQRVNAVLGRPYLSTQLASMLPADVLLRLTERLEHLIEEGVRREVDKLHEDVNEVTRQTLARLALDAEDKLRELKQERFGGAHPSSSWGG